MTLDELRSEVYQRLRLDQTAAGADETFVTRAINQGVREVLSRTHCFVNCSDITTLSNTWKYRLPGAILAFKNLLAPSTDGENTEAVRVTPAEIFDLRQANIATDTTRMRFALMGADLLLVWPTPVASGVIEAFYVPLPTEMTVGNHDPSLKLYGGVQKQYHPAIYLWALAQAADREQHSSSQAGLKYRAEFDDHIKRIKADLSQRGGRLPRATWGTRQPRVMGRNDVDLVW